MYSLPICGLNKTTLLDYPEKVAATVFLGGCNFRCPFCHNGGLVLSPKNYISHTTEEILSFLKKRQSVLSGVCITGGEPTLYEALPNFIHEIKQLGYAVKLDTNGSNPGLLSLLIRENLLDYIAMDIKSDLDHYEDVCGVPTDTTKISESVAIIRNSGLMYEFRTTVIKEFHSVNTFDAICEWLDGSKNYFLQNYKESAQVLNPIFSAYSKEELMVFLEICRPHFENCCLRGID